MTIEDSDHEYRVFEAKEPMVLRADLTEYPPRGQAYALEKPVELVETGHPEQVAATLLTFPHQRRGL